MTLYSSKHHLLCLLLYIPFCLSLVISHSLYAQSTTPVPATVNGTPIDIQIFNDQSALLLRRSKAEPSLRYKNYVARRVLKPLVYSTLLQKELKKNHLKVNEKVIEDKIKDLAKGHKSAEKFEEYLIRVGHTLASKKVQLWNVEASYLLMDKKGLLAVTDAQVKSNYTKWKSRYTRPEQVRARQILIYLPKNPTPKQVKEAFDRAQKLHQDLLKSPSSFDLLVQQYSEEPLAGRKGDLGFFTRGEMVQSVEDTVFNLKKNEISPPVRSKYGWHILKRTDSRPRRELTYKELYKQMKTNLKKVNFNRQRLAFLKELWLRYEIQSSFPVKP